MTGILQHAAMRRPPSNSNIIAQNSATGGTVTTVTLPTMQGGSKWITIALDVPFIAVIGTSAIANPTIDDVFPAGPQDFLVDRTQTTVKILASAAYAYLVWDSSQKVDQ